MLWHILNNPFRRIIQACYTLSCGRVFDKTLSVPNQATDIQFVIQNASTALAVAVNSGLSPAFTRWARYAFLVELSGNSFGRFVLNAIFSEDAADDIGLHFINLTIPFDGFAIGVELLHHLIAIS
ncbi:MAG: hypothetical protein K6L80_13230 [Agarilytica sp.]